MKNKLTMNEIDLVEFNEAFASQVIASLQLLDIPLEKVNINGGASPSDTRTVHLAALS